MSRMPKFRAIPVVSLDRFQSTQASGAGSSGAKKREAPAGTLALHEGSKTRHLFVLLEGGWRSSRAIVTGPGAMLRETSLLLDQPHTTVRAAADSIVYELDDAAVFLRDEPGAMLTVVPGARPADDAPEQFVQKRYVAVPRIVRPSP